MSSACTTCGMSTLFTPSASSSFVANGAPLDVEYGHGKVSGILGQDVTRIAGVAVQNVTFGLIDTQEVQPVQYPESGLVGLAYKTLARDDLAGLFDIMVEQNLVASNAFGMYLSYDETGTRQGQLTLGGADPDRVAGPFTYAPIVDTQWYVIHVSRLDVGTTQIESHFRAIVDSGTSCATFPKAVVDKIVAPIQIGSDCTGFHSAPNITLYIAGGEFVMTPRDYCITNPQLTSCEVCIEAFEQGATSPYSVILGDTFMRSVYTLFDRTNNRLGFAPPAKP